MHLNSLMIVQLFSCVLLHADDQTSRLDYIENAYQANFSRVSHGSFQFTHYVASARSLDAAKHGDFTEKFMGSGVYFFDEEDARYERSFDKSDILRTTIDLGNNQHSIKLLSSQLLRHGNSLCLSNSGVDLKKANVSSTIDIRKDDDLSNFLSFFSFPLEYGIIPDHPGLLRDIRAVRADPGSLVELSIEDQKHGSKMARLVLKPTPTTLRKYKLDLDRGAIPVEIIEADGTGSPVFIRLYDKLTLVQDQAWIPFSFLNYFVLGDTAKGIEITVAEIVKKPEASDYTLKFDDKYRVHDRINGIDYIRGIDSFSFLNPSVMTSTPVVERARIPSDIVALPKQPGELPRPQIPYLTYSVAGLLLFAGLTILARHYLGRSRGH